MRNNTGKASGIGSYKEPPIIKNETFTLTALTNTWFSYTIDVDGTTPINFEASKPSNYNGILQFTNINIINGKSYAPGIYNIIIKVNNAFGFDIKTLILTIYEPIKIKNTNLETYCKFGTQFSYVINSSGLPPKNYYISELTGVYLEYNIIKGFFDSIGTYNITITVSNGVESDIKNLIIHVGLPPVITSSSSVYGEINQNFNYQIISSGSDSNYKVIGTLPNGLTFRINTISGTPKEVCKREVSVIAINQYGESIKKLSITIYQ